MPGNSHFMFWTCNSLTFISYVCVSLINVFQPSTDFCKYPFLWCFLTLVWFFKLKINCLSKLDGGVKIHIPWTFQWVIESIQLLGKIRKFFDFRSEHTTTLKFYASKFFLPLAFVHVLLCLFWEINTEHCQVSMVMNVNRSPSSLHGERENSFHFLNVCFEPSTRDIDGHAIVKQKWNHNDNDGMAVVGN